MEKLGAEAGDGTTDEESGSSGERKGGGGGFAWRTAISVTLFV
jgi:hypothetical protein